MRRHIDKSMIHCRFWSGEWVLLFVRDEIVSIDRLYTVCVICIVLKMLCLPRYLKKIKWYLQYFILLNKRWRISSRQRRTEPQLKGMRANL